MGPGQTLPTISLFLNEATSMETLLSPGSQFTGRFLKSPPSQGSGIQACPTPGLDDLYAQVPHSLKASA